MKRGVKASGSSSDPNSTSRKRSKRLSARARDAASSQGQEPRGRRTVVSRAQEPRARNAVGTQGQGPRDRSTAVSQAQEPRARDAVSGQDQEPRGRRDRRSGREGNENSESREELPARDVGGERGSSGGTKADSVVRAPADESGPAAQTETLSRNYSRGTNESPESQSPQSEPSTATHGPGSLRAAIEAEADDITVNHPSMMPEDDPIDESVPQEGAGAIDNDVSVGEEQEGNRVDVDDITAVHRTAVSREDADEVSRVEQPTEDLDDVDEITPLGVPSVRVDDAEITRRTDSASDSHVVGKRSPHTGAIAGNRRDGSRTSPRSGRDDGRDDGLDFDAVTSALGEDTPTKRREPCAAEKSQPLPERSQPLPERSQHLPVGSTRRRLFTDSEENVGSAGSGDAIVVLQRNVCRIEKAVETMYERLDDKLNKIIDYQQKTDGEGNGLADIVHSLSYHMENNLCSNTYMENKILPLKTVLNDGLHKKCMTKRIVDSLVLALDTTPTLSPKSINEIARVLRIVVHSKPVGGNKDSSAADDEELEQSLVELKKEMTFILVTTMQNNPRIGLQNVSVDGKTTQLGKPSWMKPGFISTKHVVQFYSKVTRRKNAGQKAGDHDAMCDIIIRTMNDYHGKAFAKIRDRVRVDGMKEVFFIFDRSSGVDIVKARDLFTESFVDIAKVPLVNTSRLPANRVRKVVKKVWSAALEEIGDKLTYIVDYDVDVVKQCGTVERKTLVRRMNFLYAAALILMRITGNGTFFDLLTYHEKIIRLLVGIAELLVMLTEHEFLTRKRPEPKKEPCSEDDDDFHVLNILKSIRPTQSETRDEMIREHILRISEAEYEKLHYQEKEDDDSGEIESEDEENPDEERIVGEDDEDEVRMASELSGAMQFLSKA